MGNNISSNISNKIISALLTFRVNTVFQSDTRLGLGINPDLNKKINLSTTTGLNKNSSKLLSLLNPHFKQDITSGIRKNGIQIDDEIKNYIKSFQQNPVGQDALLDEFKKRLPFISEKMNKAIGKTSAKETLDTAQKVLNSEINKCRLIVQAKIEKEKILSQLNLPSGIEYKSHELPVTVNGRDTDTTVTVFEKLNLEQAHKNMQGHYIDMSKTRFDSLESVVNMGNITPAALLAILLENSTKNDYTLASKLGVTDLLKDHSLARFNQDKHKMEKNMQAITTKLTDYLNINNGRLQQTGQEIQHQGISIGK